jgi:hypothetical protein
MFPRIVFEQPAAYETEVATYNTIPIATQTPEEQEDFRYALSDTCTRKLRYVQTKNDLEFARQHPTFFVDLPQDDVLTRAISTYTDLTNEVMNHGIKLSKGQMNPPRLFDPGALNPPRAEPSPIRLVRVSGPAPAQRIEIQMTLEGILLAGGWRTADGIATMSYDDKRNTVITEISGRTSTPPADPYYYQQFTDDVLVGICAVYIFLLKARIRSQDGMLGMTADDLRNTLITENYYKTGNPNLQAMGNQQLVRIGIGWFNG